MTASLEEPPSVTSGLRVSVHPAKPALPISSCMKSYQNFMCFLHIRCSRLFVLIFLIEYLISRSLLCFRLGLCALFIADTNPREPCVSCSLEVGITFLILSYSKAKGKNVFGVVRFDTVTLFSFDFPINFLKSSLAMHYVSCSFLPA